MNYHGFRVLRPVVPMEKKENGKAEKAERRRHVRGKTQEIPLRASISRHIEERENREKTKEETGRREGSSRVLYLGLLLFIARWRTRNETQEQDNRRLTVPRAAGYVAFPALDSKEQGQTKGERRACTLTANANANYSKTYDTGTRYPPPPPLAPPPVARERERFKH